MAWTSPRTWVTSEVVTAALMNAHVRDNLLALQDRVQVVRKSADENVISSTVLQNDDHLLFAAVAGSTYVFDYVLIFTTATSAIDAKVGFSFPTGTLTFTAIAMDPAVAAGVIGSGTWGAFSSATSGTSALSVGVASAETGIRVSGSFLCTSSGNVQLMWAQNASTASNLTLKAGSNLTAIRAAV